ncbi:hypothetical protein GCM10023147_40650 [Tsukamurella soli]|uniref:HicB family protein n=1 Tax=Tsukamurella soli TaxID=644556 RepID=A0ABP8K717_9ACTN
MKLGRYVDDLHRHLAVAAAAGGEDAERLAQRLIAPLDAATRLVLLEALSAAAGEITLALTPGSVEVRLRGNEPEFVIEAGAAPTRDADRGEATADPQPVEDGPATRTTLRLPDQVKARVDEAASREGVSVNTWLVRAVTAELDRGRHPAPVTREGTAGQRLKGWAR